jgi:pimeloyl-ACP methyl ester carboxylesterase
MISESRALPGQAGCAARLAAGVLLFALPGSGLAAQSAALDRAPSRFALYNGTRVHFKSLGLGTTAVVFVHGWGCDLTYWRAQVPAVDGRVRAIFLDLPGFGRSDKPEVAYTMTYFAGAVDAVLRAAGVEHAVLVGHSMGAPVARQFYRRFRSKVTALVVVDGALRTPFGDSVQTARFVAQWDGADYAEHMSGMVDALFAGSTDTALRTSVKRQMLATPQRVAASAMRGMADAAIWRDDPIEVPLLAVMADGRNWPADYVAYVKRLAPGVRYETMSGVGHFLMLERPEEFNRLLVDFLRSQRVIR